MAQTPPYPQSSLIASVTFDFSTHVRQAGSSDNWPLTWAADDPQYTSWGNGGGFTGDGSECRVSLGIARIEANVRDFVGHDLWGDPDCAEPPAQFGGKTRTIMDIDGTLYFWGTQTPGELHLSRVPKTGIESQSQYQFFKGLNGCGQPLWGMFSERRPVFVDPNGVMRNSAIYNPGLRRYFLVTNHTENNSGNVAIFDAPEPWGPWTTVLYELGWPAGGEVERNVCFANFSPIAGAVPESAGKLRFLPWTDQPDPIPDVPDTGFRR